MIGCVVRSRVLVVVIVMVIIVGGSSLSQESISKQININFLESKRSIYKVYLGWLVLYCITELLSGILELAVYSGAVI